MQLLTGSPQLRTRILRSAFLVHTLPPLVWSLIGIPSHHCLVCRRLSAQALNDSQHVLPQEAAEWLVKANVDAASPPSDPAEWQLQNLVMQARSVLLSTLCLGRSSLPSKAQLFAVVQPIRYARADSHVIVPLQAHHQSAGQQGCLCSAAAHAQGG